MSTFKELLEGAKAGDMVALVEIANRLMPAKLSVVLEALEKYPALEGVMHKTGIDLTHEIASMKQALTALNATHHER